MNTIDFSIKRVNLLIILISSLMMFVVLNLPVKAKPFGDDFSFHAQSKNLAAYIKGDIAYNQVYITKAPGPVIFYTLAYLLAPSNPTDDQLWIFAVMATFIISTVSLLLIFRIGSNLFSKEVGLLAVLLIFIFPIHAYYSLGILAEIPAFFSFSVALYGWSKVLQNPDKIKGWILLTFGIWFFILNRPNVMLILGLGILILIYAFFKRKVFFRTYGKKLAVTFCVIGLMSYGTLHLAKIITGKNSGENPESLFYFVAHQGRFQFRDEPTDFRFWDNDVRADSKDYQNWGKSGTELSILMEKTHKSSNEVYRSFLINDALEHPFLFTRQFIVKCIFGHTYFINSVKPKDFHIGPFHGGVLYWFIILVINFVNLLLILGAFIFLFKEKNLMNYWLFWSVIAALLIFHGLTYMEPRYMFPSRVALYIMSAAGLYKIKWIQNRVNSIAKFVFP
ncbi:glycosyltransferase family 39 protein [Flavobacterium sp. AS60]|uniref:glycosyltransferase family 39 protein n=1 Tax=Flavobacterium anseongense TaxID=2910677 RepID=UPI001F212C36|nr:glycosyltransferase family 39 protein [Flavobacterium sp. AS60]MCF6129963.1 glycosyltransferase family 39 protein [Flavobacterium sp. AS60]